MDIKKYIIELEEMIVSTADGQMPLYKIKGFNTPTFDSVGVSKLTPYTEPDLDVVKKEAYEEGHKDGMQLSIDDANRDGEYNADDGWYVMQKISLLPNPIKTELFGTAETAVILQDNSFKDALAKFTEYEQEQKEIKVGDEVQHRNHSGIKVIVLNKDDDAITAIAVTNVPFACKVGEMYINRNEKDWEKTGKHYEIAEALWKLREKEL